MRNLLTGTIATLGLVTVLVSSASAESWLDQRGPGAVVNQTEETTNVDPTGQYAFEETSKSRLHRDAYAEDLARDAERGQVQTGQNVGQTARRGSAADNGGPRVRSIIRFE